MADPISGTWATGDGNYLYLKYDGQRSLAGVVTVGGRNNLATVKEGSFDPSTRAVKLQGSARNPRDGSTVSFALDGKVDGDQLHLDFRIGDDMGSATLTRVTIWRVLRSGWNALRYAIREATNPPPPPPEPYASEPRSYTRRTRAQNEQVMRERGEHPATFVVRGVREEDIVPLSWLHVVTWAATYPDVVRPPTFAIRSWQWRDAFAKRASGNWFCYVVENSKGELVGFAKGVRTGTTQGDLSKIYLLGNYQQLGLGKRMLGKVARHFIGMGITSMTVHAEADNPSCGFYVATGAENIVDAKGKKELGNYIWRDLPALSARCPD